MPWDVLDRYGADAFRWYFFTSKQPWDGYRFSLETVGEGVRLFLKQLWNTYGFFVLYANVDGIDPAQEAEPADDLDRWILSRLAPTVEEVTDRLEAFDATIGGRAIAAFVDDLSNWYVRRSRRRFWDGDPAAFATLRALPGDRRAAARAVHARSSPTRSTTTSTARRAVGAPDRLPGRRPGEPRRGARGRDGDGARDGAPRAWRRAARPRSRCASRCARRRSSPPAASGRRSSAWSRSCATSSTSRSCASSPRPTSSGSYEVKPNYRALGPRFGKAMPQVAAAVAALDPARVAAALAGGPARRASRSTATTTSSGADDLSLAMQPLEGYQLEREGSHAVALDLSLDDELRREGWAREVVHAVQTARKAAGLAVEDRIALALGGDAELLDVAREHEAYVAGETLATSVAYRDGDLTGEVASVDGRELRIAVRRA